MPRMEPKPSNETTPKNGTTVGVLLTNLGTPDAPTAAAVRKYLREFLSDPRVVKLPRALWWPILYGFILPLRPRRSAAAYQKIWTDEGSPLRSISQAQVEQLQDRVNTATGGKVRIALAMRYGNPAIGEALNTLRNAGLTHLLVLPLYPQYSATTTASTIDAVHAALTSWHEIPELRTITDYHEETGYIDALAASVREARGNRTAAENGKLLISFHGIPQAYVDAGDNYDQQCRQTARLLVKRLGLSEKQWQLSFQSRLGARPWLQPYTDITLKEWAADGIKNVDVICPGFAADCLETLEEINIGNRTTFLQAGGENFHYISALNTREDHLAMLRDLVLRNVKDWLN